MQKFWNIFFAVIAMIIIAPDLWAASHSLPLTGWPVWSVALNSAWATFCLTDLFRVEGR